MSKGNSMGNGAVSCVGSLWETGLFKSWHNQKSVDTRLAKQGVNLPSSALRMALGRAQFLTSRMNNGMREYIQKFPPTASDSGGAVTATRLSLFATYDLHDRIKEVVGKKYENGHYAEAVEAVLKEVIKRVKDYVNARNSGTRLDGDKVMNRAFGFENQEPLIKFNAVQSDEEKDEQRGILNLFKGIVGIRNRKAHENTVLNDPLRALEYLSLASLLMRLLDEYAE
jgi:uncharacterized protein (TIGR02391 family)